MLKNGIICRRNVQKPLWRVRKMPFFKIWTQMLNAQNFLIEEMALFLNFGLNWAKQDFLEKRSKSTQKMRKFKSCRWHPIFVSHMKFCKKIIFNGSHHWKWHGNGQKKTKNPFGGTKKCRFSQSEPRFWKLWFFWCEKWPFFQFQTIFGKTDFFGPKKHVSSLLGGFYPFCRSFYRLILHNLSQTF